MTVQLKDETPITELEPQVISLIGVASPKETAILATSMAITLAKQGFKILFLDLGFDEAIIPLIFNNSQIQNSAFSTNDYYAGSIELDEFLEKTGKMEIDPLEPPFEYVLSSTEPSKIRLISEETDERSIRQSLRRLNKLVRKIKQEQKYDFVIFTLPGVLRDYTVNAIIASSFSFLIMDQHETSLNLGQQLLKYISATHPLIQINGVIVYRYPYLPSVAGNHVQVAKVESMLQIPVVAKIQQLSDLIPLYGPLVPFNSLITDSFLSEMYKCLVESVLQFIESPRRVEKDQPLSYEALLILCRGGLPLFQYVFEGSRLKGELGLTAAGLTGIIAGIASMMSEIARVKQDTELIEMDKMKLFVEDRKRFRVILIANKYDEEIRRKLKQFTKAFSKDESVCKKLDTWMGEIGLFDEEGNKLVEKFFLT